MHKCEPLVHSVAEDPVPGSCKQSSPEHKWTFLVPFVPSKGEFKILSHPLKSQEPLHPQVSPLVLTVLLPPCVLWYLCAPTDVLVLTSVNPVLLDSSLPFTLTLDK